MTVYDGLHITNYEDCAAFSCDVTCPNSAHSFEFLAGNIKINNLDDQILLIPHCNGSKNFVNGAFYQNISLTQYSINTIGNCAIYSATNYYIDARNA